MDSYVFSWIPMDSLWIFKDSYGFLCVIMESYGLLLDSYGFLDIPMDSYAFLCILMDSYGFLQDSYGFLYIPMDSCITEGQAEESCQAARFLAGAFRKLSGLGPSEVLCISVFLYAPSVSSGFKDFYRFLWIPMYSYGFL